MAGSGPRCSPGSVGRLAPRRRDPSPSIAAIDSQSVKTAEGSEQRGTDGGKKVKGRKGHIVVDSLGFPLAVVVNAGNVDDGQAAQEVFAQVRGRDFPRLEIVYADNKYHNYDLYEWLVRHRRPYDPRIVRRPEGQFGFEVLPKRWVVERTLAWLGRARRLSEDYEHTVAASQAQLQLAAIQHLLRRIAPQRLAHSQRFRLKRTQRKQAA